MFRLFRRTIARTTDPTVRLTLESLDRRDVPSAVTGDDLRAVREWVAPLARPDHSPACSRTTPPRRRS